MFTCLHLSINNNINSTVEIVFMNLLDSSKGINSGSAHPVHLHGHHFQIIHIGYGNCTNETGTCHHPDITCGSQKGHCDANVSWSDGRKNFRNGTQELSKNDTMVVEKDTVIVPVGGYIVIQFRADNPGWWFLHCHIEPHQVEGMSMVVREGTPPPPPDSFPKCGNFEITTPPSSPTSGSSSTPLSGPVAATIVVFAFIGLVMLIIIPPLVLIGIVVCASNNKSHY